MCYERKNEKFTSKEAPRNAVPSRAGDASLSTSTMAGSISGCPISFKDAHTNLYRIMETIYAQGSHSREPQPVKLPVGVDTNIPQGPINISMISPK